MELTQEQAQEVIKLKEYFPFRICFGAIKPDTGEFQARADTTRRFMNQLLRQGWLVFQARK